MSSTHHTSKQKTDMPFPKLTTKRLTLRQLSMDDQPGIFTLRTDPEVNKYLGRQTSKTLEDAANFIDSILTNNALYWAITVTNSQDFAGTICLFDISAEKCEIGYELLPGFQGRGIMQEALEKVLAYAFLSMQVQTVEAFTHIDNQKSIKLLEKIGFQQSTVNGPDNPHHCIFTLTNLKSDGTVLIALDKI